MKKSAKVAVVGVLAAASIAVVFVLGLIPGIGMIGALLAGILLIFERDLVGPVPAYLTYLVTSVILIFISAKKAPAGAYALLLGYYPILYTDLERLRNPVLRYTVKFIIFEGVGAGVLMLARFVLHLEAVTGKILIAGIIAYEIAVVAYELALRFYFSLFNEDVAQRLRQITKINPKS